MGRHLRGAAGQLEQLAQAGLAVADAVDDLLAFFQQHVLHQRGLGLVVRGVDAHGLGNDDVLALAQQAAPQFQVHAIAHALLKQSVLFQQVAPEDGGLVRNGRFHHGQRAPVDRGVDLAEDAVVGVGHEQVAADDRRPAARRRRAQFAQRAREVQVVRVLPAHVFAGGALEALVDGMRLAPVRLAFPMGQVAFVFADDVHAAVGGAAVDDDVLQPRIPLIQHGQDGSLQEAGLVV